jgi:signal transduction histidine kinase
MKVWVKIALLNSLVLFLLALLIAMAMRNVVINAVQDHSLKMVELVALTSADRVANDLLLGDRYNVERALQNVLNVTPGIEYVFIVGVEGELFANTFKNGNPPDLLLWNPLENKQRSIQLLSTEGGYINDIGVKIFNGGMAELHIGVQGASIKHSLIKIRKIVILLTAIMAVFGTLMSFVLSHLLTKPLNQLTLFAQTLSRGNFGKTIPLVSKDEIGKLTETFNVLSLELESDKAKLEESYRRMCITDKVGAMSRLSAGLAHELRNPITAIKILLNTVKKTSDITEKDIDIVLSEITYMDNILGKFLDSTRSDDLSVSREDINEIIAESLALIRIQLDKQEIRVNFNPTSLPKVMVNRSIMGQALLNLFINAMEAMPQGGNLSINTNLIDDDLIVEICDNGIGIPEELHDRIFEPFFTTKSEGTGFGLFIVDNIISSHHGQLSFKSAEKGTTFTINLPLKGAQQTNVN